MKGQRNGEFHAQWQKSTNKRKKSIANKFIYYDDIKRY